MALKLTAVKGAKAAIQQESAAEQDVFLMGEELKWAVSIVLTEAQQTVKDMIEEGERRVKRAYRNTLGSKETTASYIDTNNHASGTKQGTRDETHKFLRRCCERAWSWCTRISQKQQEVCSGSVAQSGRADWNWVLCMSSQPSKRKLQIMNGERTMLWFLIPQNPQ